MVTPPLVIIYEICYYYNMAEDLMDKVFSFFSGENLTDDKQNMLKSIAKELGNSKFAKFFRVRS